MKLNLGCGYNKMDGFLNVDNQIRCQPDMIVDLEELPWPFESNSADELVLCHVLEHLGETRDIYLRIIQEIYRVCQHEAKMEPKRVPEMVQTAGRKQIQFNTSLANGSSLKRGHRSRIR